MSKQSLLDLEGAPQVGAPSVSEAMRTAGKVLARRGHSVKELRTKLSAHPPEEIELAVERLLALGLLDDLEFARTWVRDRSKKRGPAVLRAELEERGVAPELIETALREGPDELQLAKDLAATQLTKVIRKPLPAQAASVRGALLRRGFDPETALEATRAVLPPDGWD